nr:carboxypeptidase-like regulatory domain-containing protein [uncultured Bacteroides sp.]
MKSNSCFSFFLFFISLNLGAQVKLSGCVKGLDLTAVPYCNVILKDSVNAKIVKYTQTNKEGYYSLSINTAGCYNISFSALSFKTETIPIFIDRNNSEISQNAVLSNTLVELKEVVIHPNSPIIIKKDTIIFDAKSFTKGNEHVVEDLLKNLPGLHIDSDGRISIAGKEIEKVMVEGDDFFEKGYQLLTKSMLSSSIDKIELLKRYSNNKLLKDIEQSDKIALNLKLKDENKREWFGNTDIGLGLNKFSKHDAQGNLMNFGKKDKYYLLANTNNVGYDIGDYAANNSLENLDEIGDGESAFRFMRFASDPLSFESKRTNFNNTNLLSLNTILKPLQKLKIKMSFLTDRNKNNFTSYSSGYYRTENLSFTNTLDSKLHSNSKIGYGKVDLTYDIYLNSILEILTNYRNEYDIGLNNNLFNDIEVAEHLETDRTLFNQKIRFVYRAKNKQILKITTNYIQDKIPQNYNANNSPFNARLFPDIQKADEIGQYIHNRMKFIGVDICYMKKQNNIIFFEFHLGNSYRKDVLDSFIQDKTTMKDIEKYENDVICVANNLFFNSKYSLSYKKILVSAELGLNNNFIFFDRL